MSKVTTYLSITGGLMLLCYFAGILPNSTISGTFMNALINPHNLENTDAVTKIIATVTLVGLIGTVAFARFTPSEFYILVPFVTLLLTFCYDFIQIYDSLASTGPIARVISILIFGPFIMMYFVSIIEWWRGAA